MPNTNYVQAKEKTSKVKISEKQRNFDKAFRQEFNTYRKSLNIKKLKTDNKLIRVARVRAKELVIDFSHTRPKSTLIKLCDSKGVSKEYQYFGEILAKLKIGKTEIHNNQEYNSIANMTINAWKDSPSHNKVMKNKKYNRVSTSYFIKNGNLYVCTIFAG